MTVFSRILQRSALAAAVGAVAYASLAPAAAHAGAASGAPAPTTGFLSTPTDQLAVPGFAAGAEVTPAGDLYTGWAEYELSFGTPARPWDQPTRTLPNPALPLLSSTLTNGGVSYTLSEFAVTVAGAPVAYYSVRATNTTTATVTAQVQMAVSYSHGPQIRGSNGITTGAYLFERPVISATDGFATQPGEVFSPAFSYSVVGRDLIRSGLLLAHGPTGGTARLTVANLTSLTAPHDVVTYRTILPVHGSTTYTWQIPLSALPVSSAADTALDAVPLAAARVSLAAAWAAQEQGMMRISVPEAKVSDTYEAAIVELLSSRYLSPTGWVQAVNKLQYQAFWLRDAAIMTQALDLAGLHVAAGENLSFLDTYQQAGGLFISRTQQYDGFGQALWALTQHALLTESPAYATAVLPSLTAALSWLQSATVADPLGLLPAGSPGDDELASGHITGDNLWAAVGLRSAVTDAILAGRPDLAAAWQAVDDRFESALDSAVTAAVTRTGYLPPVLDSPSGQNWGNYNIAYPLPILPLDSAAVTSTLAYANSHLVQGLPTYDNGRALHEYLGFPIFQAELASGQRAAAVAGLYAELVHTTSTDQGWEESVTPWGPRSSTTNLSPHGTFSGDYIALLRNMLLSDTAGGVTLLPGASPAWLAPGQQISVENAPTDHGVISYTERSTATGETLSWSSDYAPSSTVTWTLPPWAKDLHPSAGVLTGQVLTLPGASGTVTVTFTGQRPAQSYAQAAAALDAAYREHGQPAPLMPATS